MLTDDELDSIYEKHKHAGEEGWEYDHDAIARAAIAAYQAKLLAGVEMPDACIVHIEDELNSTFEGYSEADLITYGDARDQAGYLRGLEGAKRVCLERANFHAAYNDDARNVEANDCAAAIDKLKGGE